MLDRHTRARFLVSHAELSSVNVSLRVIFAKQLDLHLSIRLFCANICREVESAVAWKLVDECDYDAHVLLMYHLPEISQGAIDGPLGSNDQVFIHAFSKNAGNPVGIDVARLWAGISRPKLNGTLNKGMNVAVDVHVLELLDHWLRLLVV